MSFSLTNKDRKRLNGVHPDLMRVVEHAAQNSPVTFMVVEGLRSVKRQRYLVNSGKSKTMNSRHLTGHAVDLCALINGKDVWTKPYSVQIADTMKASAASIGIEMQFGIDWGWDAPHFQLDHGTYPKQDTSWKDAEDSSMRIGSRGEDVRKVQAKLAALGYQVGTPNGHFGPATQRAVAAFEVDHGIPNDGVVDDDCLEAIENAKPIEQSEPRQNATAKDLRDMGSSQAKAALQGKIGAGGAGGLLAVTQIGGSLSSASEKVSEASDVADKTSGLIDTLGGIVSSPQTWLVIMAFGVCLLGYFWFQRMEDNRVREHREGANLSR